MGRTNLGVILGGLLILMSCTRSNVLEHQSFTLPESGWERSHKLKGSWTTDKTTTDGTVVLRITHTPEFGYQNIYLTGMLNRDSEQVFSDTFSIQLARPNNGQWLGQSVGDLIQVIDTLPCNLSLNQNETFQFEISHHSRQANLKGIAEVTIQLVSP